MGKVKREVEECRCGECCRFYAEDTYGFGSCPFRFADVCECGNKCTEQEHFVSKGQMRHYMAVLVQHNRWRRSDEVPNHCRMVNPAELGKAIDFAVKYMKVFSNL